MGDLAKSVDLMIKRIFFQPVIERIKVVSVFLFRDQVDPDHQMSRRAFVHLNYPGMCFG